jgi:cysteine-rich repeat protein
MNSSSTQLVFALAFVGAAAACPVEYSPNPDHCYHALGDRTCWYHYGDVRGYCVGPATGCVGAEDYHGCVAEPPSDECYSPCGGDAYLLDDSSCIEVAEDETDTGLTGPACGDGVLDVDETCDDGNNVDDDECSNSCEPAICGDAITQSILGETCDDGNTASGDACAWNCTLPGTVVWSRLYDGESCIGASLGLTPAGAIDVAINCTGMGRKLMQFDAEGTLLWSDETPLSSTGPTNIAVAGDHAIVLGGAIGTQGHVRYLDGEGTYEWSANIPVPSSRVTDVAIHPTGDIIAVGWGTSPFLHRYSADGDLEWSIDDLPGTSPDAVAVDADGHIRVMRGGPLQVASYSASGSLQWTSAELFGSVLNGLAVGADGGAHVVGYSNDLGPEVFQVQKIDTYGGTVWLETHDQPDARETANAVAMLPGGAIIVAGYTNGHVSKTEKDGLLSWYSESGANFHDAVFDDGAENDDADVLYDVAVSTDYAVAVGYRLSSDDVRQLWLLKVAI